MIDTDKDSVSSLSQICFQSLIEEISVHFCDMFILNDGVILNKTIM